MSLQVWLPLNGNLNNQGLSEVTVTNSGATVDSNGKIGGCYSFDGGTDRVSISDPLPFTEDLTIAAWIKPTNVSSTTTQYALSYNTDTGGTAGHLLGIGMYGSSALTVWYSGTAVTTSVTLVDNTWYHVAASRAHTGELKVYVNGSCILTSADSNAPSSRWFTIGGRSNSATGGAGGVGYCFKGSVNDVRLYDHCLSAKEVKEISKGLTLHYPMNDPYVESTTNYSSQSAGVGGWNNSGNSARSGNDTSLARIFSTSPVISILQTVAGNSAFTFGMVQTPTYPAIKGAKVTASVYAYISDVNCSANTVYLRSTINDNKAGNEICVLSYKGSTNPQTWPKNQWIRISGTGTVVSNETAAYFCTYTANLNEKRYFTGWQLEIKDHVTPFADGSRNDSLCFDSSGFSNDGVVKKQNAISVEKDSPRYDVSTVFNGTPFIIGQNLDGAKSTDALSLCAWINPSQVSEGNIISSYEGGGAGLHILSGNIYFQIYSSGYTGVSGGTISANTWYYVVGTYDNSKLRIYINGELKGEVAKTGNITYNSSTPWSVAVNPSGTSDGGEHFYGKLSDVRIYATALSASDIKELYNTSASIDKNGNMYAYEFKEE